MSIAPVYTLTTVQTPLVCWPEPDQAPHELKALFASIESLVVHPLKRCSSEEDWADTIEAVLPVWTGLRIALTQALLDHHDVSRLDEVVEYDAAQAPLVLLPEPASGAVRYAIRVLVAAITASAGDERHRPPADLDYLATLVESVAIIELCWLSLMGQPVPAREVAEAAAWEAYAQARPLREDLMGLGLDARLLPAEVPEDASARALCMLDRVCGGWTPAERAAVMGGLAREERRR